MKSWTIAIWIVAVGASAAIFRIVDVGSHSASDTLIGAVPLIAAVLLISWSASALIGRVTKSKA